MERHEVSGHEFTRADKAPKMSPGLYRLRENSMERHEVSGHEFTRADKAPKMSAGFSPRRGRPWRTCFVQ